jgi:hypothetical protein
MYKLVDVSNHPIYDRIWFTNLKQNEMLKEMKKFPFQPCFLTCSLATNNYTKVFMCAIFI